MSACYTYVSVVARNGCLLVIHMSVWWFGMYVCLLFMSVWSLGMDVCLLYICQCGS